MDAVSSDPSLASPSSASQALASRDWLAAYRDGDTSAFTAIVQAFQVRLIQFFYRLCWDRDRAEDLTQDLFLKLLRGAARYHEEGKLSTYVFRVATNLWIDHYRAVRPLPRFSSLDQVLVEGEPSLSSAHRSEPQNPLQHVIAGEERAELRRAIEKLTAPHRLVFELAVFQELPYGEIASVLEIPVGTVKSRMHNSVHALKDLLGQKLASTDPAAPQGGSPSGFGTGAFRSAAGA